jgi:hypothetical protein
MRKMVRKIAGLLNLKPHRVGRKFEQIKMIYTCGDIVRVLVRLVPYSDFLSKFLGRAFGIRRPVLFSLSWLFKLTSMLGTTYSTRRVCFRLRLPT